MVAVAILAGKFILPHQLVLLWLLPFLYLPSLFLMTPVFGKAAFGALEQTLKYSPFCLASVACVLISLFCLALQTLPNCHAALA